MNFSVNNQAAYAYTGGRQHDPEQPAIVFVHGAQNDHSVWGLQSRYLAHHGYRVLAVDLPGHGRGQGSPLATIEEIATWVLDAMTACAIERAWIVGHSMGSLVALATAGLAADRVDGIALVGTAWPMRVSDVLLDAAAEDESNAISMILRWSHSGLNHQPGSPGPGFSIYQCSRQLMRRQAPGVLLTDFKACNGWDGGPAMAAARSCPAIVISGKNDMMTTPKAGAAMTALLNSSGHASAGEVVEQIVLEGCGHNIMAEQPAELLQTLSRWLQAIRSETVACATSVG